LKVGEVVEHIVEIDILYHGGLIVEKSPKLDLVSLVVELIAEAESGGVVHELFYKGIGRARGDQSGLPVVAICGLVKC
jgi:hypothetical protein